MGLRWLMVRLVVRRPWLIPKVAGLSWATRAHDWYRRPPFLPVPPAAYLRWRMETAYGHQAGDPPLSDVARYVEWAARMRRHG